jgi:arginyl-tRNA synthetase
MTSGAPNGTALTDETATDLPGAAPAATADRTPADATVAPAPAAGILAREETRARDAIRRAVVGLNLAGGADRYIDLRSLPFAGTWGAATTVARALASDLVTAELEAAGETEGLSKKELKRKVNERIPEASQRVAESIRDALLADPVVTFGSVEAVNGYVNISFDASAMALDLIGEVIGAGDRYGQGAAIDELVMVEHSQPNTHKAFHVGHLRNTSLGVAVSRILAKAGYRVMDATYIGDIGRHVIQCLWCYEQFHRGQEPVDIMQRGRWLGELYAESERRLRYRQSVLDFLTLLAKEDYAFIAGIDRSLKYLWRAIPTETGEDVAYFLHRFTHAGEIRETELSDPNIVVAFWPIIGDFLRDQVENPKPLVLIDGQAEPTTTPEERLATWTDLAGHITDWWPAGPEWREQMAANWRRWEAQEPTFVALWNETREWSLVAFRPIFAELGARFDVWFFESEVEEPGKLIVKELLERGIAEISDGLPVVKIDEQLGLETETYRTLPILRSDGTSLYATKDLALTKLKFDDYHVDRALWVVDVRQSLYFQQIVKVLELWGFEQAKRAGHIVYEHVTLPEGAISSRKGNAPLYEDVRNLVLNRAREIIAEKNPDLPTERAAEVAEQVAIGSLKYAMLARDNNKVVIFDVEEALSFEGHSAPYIQYAHARACRIMERAEVDHAAILARLPETRFVSVEPAELDLLQQLAAFPEWIQRAAAENRPTIICQYVYELAQTFNDFYHACPVIQSEEPQRTARLALVAATRQTLANALDVLGIAAPTQM